jgi:predicted GTPase
MGHCRERNELGAQVSEGMRREGSLLQVRAVCVSLGAHRTTRYKGPESDSRGGSGKKKRITTSQVNTTLASLIARKQPPQAAGREVKLNYATQVETAPPTIAVFGNNPDLVQEHYIRYLHNGFREAWGFTGSPLRIVMRRKSA